MTLLENAQDNVKQWQRAFSTWYGQNEASKSVNLREISSLIKNAPVSIVRMREWNDEYKRLESVWVWHLRSDNETPAINIEAIYSGSMEKCLCFYFRVGLKRGELTEEIIQNVTFKGYVGMYSHNLGRGREPVVTPGVTFIDEIVSMPPSVHALVEATEALDNLFARLDREYTAKYVKSIGF